MAGRQGAAPADPAVLLERVCYDVPGKRILSNVDLAVRRGEIFAIMGMSGSGKTSLLKCIAGLTKPSSGRILIEGADIVPIDEARLDAVRVRMGLVFQYAALFDSLTVGENVAFGLVHNGRGARAEQAQVVERRLAEVGMAGSERLYPAQLSGGMQKRVGLARALAMDPLIVLYDEPTSGLDPVIAATIDGLIADTRARHGVTSIVVSHDVMSVFRLADRIAMVEAGAVIACGTPADLLASADERVMRFAERARGGEHRARG